MFVPDSVWGWAAVQEKCLSDGDDVVNVVAGNCKAEVVTGNRTLGLLLAQLQTSRQAIPSHLHDIIMLCERF